ncbi:hypothetical protein KXX57_004072 [Aspergillus fumigatus]|nr:hypothetical protein KXX57_004072 [Aspergillus fumigatus]KAH1974133.1 hypothetical protein KXW88_001025 [Aspergillus fumigatus]KAH2749324.1 hypothetical protein KXV94_003673 [Aspergillus fumigatus]KAH3137460.1 hypothetical protein KXW18_005395 [Aspergillus fumigatus]KAH3523939.1 hypothetical protein KXV64_005195 [Aspergillus fumigatus]
MHNVKTLPALLCLLLAVGPTAVLSAPIADVASLDKRQVTHSNTDAASVMGAGIPDGPSFNQNDFFSTSNDEDRDVGDGDDGSQSGFSTSTDAGDFATFGIPDGPSATFGKAFHHDYEEAHSKHPETTPVPEPSPPTPPRQLPPLIIPVPAVERP